MTCIPTSLSSLFLGIGVLQVLAPIIMMTRYYLLSLVCFFTGDAMARYCQNRTIEVLVSARNAVFNNLETPNTNEGATNFAVLATTQGFNATAYALTDYATVSGRYRISTQYCSPSASSSAPGSAPVLQILTHGIGFDKRYWDLPYNNYNYSYVNSALAHGYHTLTYDRLGIGNSSHGEPKNEIQTALEVESLVQITRLARDGTFPGIPKPRRIIHVGHSFGSVQTYHLTALYPDLSDAVVLTGFSLNLSFFPLVIAGGDWQQTFLTRPPGYPYNYTAPGYLTTANINADQYLFCHFPAFDPGLLAYTDRVKQPVTIGELLTFASGLPAQSSFAKPVLLVTGAYDVPFCGADCYNTGITPPHPPPPPHSSGISSIPANAQSFFPNAAPFQAYIQPDCGHAINLHYVATAAYGFIAAYLQANGLGA